MNMKYFPTCTSRLVVQHPCQVSFKSMQGCRRSWEDKLKCVKILSVKDHNSAKICRTWIISPHALLDLWYNICTKFHSNPCKDVGGVRRQTLMGRKDGMTDKANTKCPLAIFTLVNDSALAMSLRTWLWIYSSLAIKKNGRKMKYDAGKSRVSSDCVIFWKIGSPHGTHKTSR